MDTYLGNLKDTTVEAASHALGDKVNYDAPDLASVPSIVHLPAVADPLKVQYSCAKIQMAGASTISWWTASARWRRTATSSTPP